MADYRPIKTSIWHDEWFFGLAPEEKIVWIFLLTNEHLHISGIYQLPKPLVRAFVGVDSSDAIIEKFERDEKIVIREGWIFIKNYMRNQLKQINKFDNIVKSISAYISENPKVIDLFKLHDEAPYKPLLSPLATPTVKLKGERVKSKEERVKEEGEPLAPLADESKASRQPSPEASISWLGNMPADDVAKMVNSYHIDEAFVLARAQDVVDYCEAKGKRYADYRAALRNFIKSHITKHPDSVRKPVTPHHDHAQKETDKRLEEANRIRTPEEQASYEAKMREIREKLSKNLSFKK